MDRSPIPDPGYATFPGMLRMLADRFGPRDCIVLGDRRLSFAEAESASARLARVLLASGVGKGTRVALLAPNGPEFVVGMLAVGRIGAVLVPVNTLYQTEELGWTLRHADVHTLLTVPSLLSHDYVARLEEAVSGLAGSPGPELRLPSTPCLRRIHVFGGCDRAWALPDVGGAAEEVDDALLRAMEEQVRPADEGLVIYTSGSTADPKGIVHTQGSLVRHSWWLGQGHGFVPEDRIFTPNAFFFIGGFVFSLLAPMQTGACLICEERFDPGETLDLIERERATIVTGWPHYGPAMKAHDSFARRDLSAIRAGYLYDILPDDAVRFPYSLGMSETCSPHTFWPPGKELPKGSLGVAVPGVEHRVIDPENGVVLPPGSRGELCVRGYTLMQGMVGREREEVFDADGWYHTGDEVTIDADGHVTFHGRLTDVIKTSGANVSPQEVERALMALPGVLEAHVVGLSDPERGQLVAAAVVPDGSVELAVDALRSDLRARLAAYKVPRRFDFFRKPDLPYKATGKIDKRALVTRMEST
jgi:acyl-coenzyme A synthetase/AMP-(fatty) acid ligase